MLGEIASGPAALATGDGESFLKNSPYKWLFNLEVTSTRASLAAFISPTICYIREIDCLKMSPEKEIKSTKKRRKSDLFMHALYSTTILSQHINRLLHV